MSGFSYTHALLVKFRVIVIVCLALGFFLTTPHTVSAVLDCSNPPDGVVCKSGIINADETWVSSNVYVVNDNLTIRASITIEEGTIVKVQYGKYIDIQSLGGYNGRLIVNGTSGNEVVFTSLRDDFYGGDTNGDGSNSTPARGDWLQIWVYNSLSSFNYARIRYNQQGLGVFSGTNDTVAPPITNSVFENNQNGLTLRIGSTANGDITSLITNNVFRNNLYGIKVDALNGSATGTGTAKPSLASNTFEGNSILPLYLGWSAFPVYGTGNTFIGYPTPNQRLAIGISGTFMQTGSLPVLIGYEGIEIPYVVLDNWRIASSAVVTIDPGTVIKVELAKQIEILGTLNLQSSTMTDPIIFTSSRDDISGDTNGDGENTTPTAGDWSSLTAYNDSTVFKNVYVYYSSLGIRYYNNSVPDSYPLIEHCYFYDNKTSVYFESGSTATTAYITHPKLINNHFIRSQSFPIVLNGSSYWTEINSNTFTESRYPAIGLLGNWYGSGVWEAIIGDSGDIFPYAVIGYTYVQTDAQISVPAGMVFKFVRGAAPNYNRHFISAIGTITLNGTDQSPVIFTSFQDDSVSGDTNADGSATLPTYADWEGYYIYDSANAFHNAVLRYSNVGLTIRNKTNINIQPEVHHATFYKNNIGINLWVSANGNILSQIHDNLFDANGQGIFTNITEGVEGSSTPSINSNTFSNQTGYPIYLGGTAYPSYSNNIFSNNHYSGIGLAGYFNASGTFALVEEWAGGPNLPYVVEQVMYIGSSATVTILPDTIIKMQVRSGVTDYRYIYAFGNIDFQSTVDHPIYITSIRDDYGGDTNNDGSATYPSPADWDSIYLLRSETEYKFITTSYGTAGVTVRGLEIDINPPIHDNIFRYNTYGVRIELRGTGDVTSTIQNNTFDHNEYGFYSYVNLNTTPYSQGVSAPTLINNNFTGYNSLSYNDYPIYLNGTADPIYINNTFTNHTHPAIAVGGYWGGTHQVTWKKVIGESGIDFPYVVVNTLTQDFGNTIHVPAGTIIKFISGKTVGLSGIWDLQSTEAQPIVLTSFKDDTYAGDTNGDGSNSSPAPSDWETVWIFDVHDKITNLNNLVVKYSKAGIAYYYDRGPSIHINPSIKNCLFENNWVGMLFFMGWSQNTGHSGDGNINVLLENVSFLNNYYDLVTYTHQKSTGIIHPTFQDVSFDSTQVYPLFFGGTTFPTFVGTNVILQESELELVDLLADHQQQIIMPDIMSLPGTRQHDHSLSETVHNNQVSESVSNNPNGLLVVDNTVDSSPVHTAIALGGFYNPNCELDDGIDCILPAYSDVPYVVPGNYPLTIIMNGTSYIADPDVKIGLTLPDPDYPTKTYVSFPIDTIVKFGLGRSLSVYGTIKTQGTKDDMVIFTSIRDDTVGGDTNKDGNITLPLRSDWLGVYLYSSDVKFENSLVQYSNYGVYIYFNNTDSNAQFSPEILSNIFRYNTNGITMRTANAGNIQSYIHDNLFIDNQAHILGLVNSSTGKLLVNIENNDFLFPAIWAIKNDSTNWVLDAEDNYWCAENGPFDPIGNPDGLGVPVSERVDYSPYRTSPAFQYGTYEVQGYIKLEEGNGLANVRVHLSDGTIVETNYDGFYAFTNLSPGRYSVTFETSGYTFTPPSIMFDVPPAHLELNALAMPITGETYLISGRVLDSFGLPVSQVEINLEGSGIILTSDSGAYTFENLYAGTYIVTPSYQSYTFNPPSRTVTVGPNATGVNFIINAAVGEGFRLALPLVLR